MKKSILLFLGLSLAMMVQAQTSSSTITATACGTYAINGSSYTISGQYHQTLKNNAGYDSIITLNLTINPLPLPVVFPSKTTACVTDGNVLINLMPSINANSSLTCSTPSMLNFYNQFMPSGNGRVSGNYTLTYNYTDVNGCNAKATANISTIYVDEPIPISNATLTYPISNDLAFKVSAQALTAVKWYNESLSTVVGTGNTYTPTIPKKGTTPDSLVAGEYKYYYTQTVNGCESIASTANFLVTNCRGVAPNVAVVPSMCIGSLAYYTTTLTATNMGMGYGKLYWFSSTTTSLYNALGEGSFYHVSNSQTGSKVYYVAEYDIANQCFGPTNSVVVTINPTPTITVTANPTAIYAGAKATLTVSGASSYFWKTGATGNTISVTPSITTAYSVTGINSYGCRDTASITVTYLPTTTSTWNGTGTWNTIANWTPAFLPPTNASIIVASGELTSDQDHSVQNACVNVGAKFKVNAGTSFSVSNLFIIKSNATGNGSFICDGKYGGTIVKVEQFLTGGRNTYISSPITNATSSVIKTPLTNKLWSYDEPSTSWTEITDASTILRAMKGYVAYVPHDTVITFTGDNVNNVLNTFSKTTTVTHTGNYAKTGFNLIGNPFTSCVNWEMATKTNVEPTLWYRTKNANNAYVFDSYNATLHVGTNNNGKGAVSQYIPPMQAVWVRVLPTATTGTIYFDITMQSHQVTGNILKSDNEISAIHLQVSNNKNSDETILVFNENASNSLDDFDSHKMFVDNADVPEIYTTASTEKLVINGLKSFESANVIPLGFKTAKAGTFTISATDISGISGTVMLEDKLLNKSQDLSQTPSYSFTSDSVDNAGRFALHLKAQETTTETKLEGNVVFVYTKDNAVVVKTSEVQTGTVMVFDVLGQIVTFGALTGMQTLLPLPAVAGAYFVKVETGGEVTSYRVISYK